MLKGSLLLYKDLVEKITLNDKYNKLFFDEIEARMGYDIKFIRDYLGDKQFIEFLDIMSGLRLFFPSEKELKDMVLGVQVKIYYDSLGGEEFNIGHVAKKFGIGLSKARKLVAMYSEDYDIDKEKTFAEMEEEYENDSIGVEEKIVVKKGTFTDNEYDENEFEEDEIEDEDDFDDED